jgi:hypothetical protein
MFWWLQSLVAHQPITHPPPKPAHSHAPSSSHPQEQEIDLFGEISGVSLSPCGAMLFVGVSGGLFTSGPHCTCHHNYAYIINPTQPTSTQTFPLHQLDT